MAYVYRHIRVDKNQPFYIGIGSDLEGKYSRAKAYSSRNSIWKKIVSKTKYRIDIVLDDISIEEAFNIEIELISIYGKIIDKSGILSNITNGGEGTLGTKWSEIRKGKYSIKMKGRVSPMKGKTLTDEHKRRISISKTGEKRTKEFCKRLSIICSGRKRSKESIEKTLATRKGKGIKYIAHNSKTIINTQSGIYYDSILDAAKSIPMKVQTLRDWLSGRYKNKSYFIYA